MRAAMRSVLRALPANAVTTASASACSRAATLAMQASAVSVYLAMPRGEADTQPLLDALFAAGKRVFVPRVEGDERDQMRMLHVADSAMLASFPRSKWKIPEPTDADAASMEDGLHSAAIDLVIVPAVAFDPTCRRLGQGRGYYDTFLEKLSVARSAKGLAPAVTVGLGLQEQLVPSVPSEPHDFVLDYVCLPDQLVRKPSSE